MRVSKLKRVPLIARVGKLPKKAAEETVLGKNRRYGVAYVLGDKAVEVRLLMPRSSQPPTVQPG